MKPTHPFSSQKPSSKPNINPYFTVSIHRNQQQRNHSTRNLIEKKSSEAFKLTVRHKCRPIIRSSVLLGPRRSHFSLTLPPSPSHQSIGIPQPNQNSFSLSQKPLNPKAIPLLRTRRPTILCHNPCATITAKLDANESIQAAFVPTLLRSRSTPSMPNHLDLVISTAITPSFR